MSTFNEPLAFLEKSINSILNQTLKDFELIIINDNPKREESKKFLRACAKKDKRIILVENRKNIGLTRSLNNGIDIAKGKYIARMDADDISMKDRLQRQYSFLESNPRVFLLGTNSIIIDDNGNEKKLIRLNQYFRNIKRALKKDNIIFHSSIMFRNSFEIRYRDKFYYSQDYDLYLRLLSENKIIYVLDETLIKHRIRSDSISQSQGVKQRLFAEKAKEFYQQRLREGTDHYNSFDPSEILEIDLETTKNKTVLRQEIFNLFLMNNPKKARELCKRYFNNYGILNKMLLYYLSSFIGRKKSGFIAKILRA